MFFIVVLPKKEQIERKRKNITDYVTFLQYGAMWRMRVGVSGEDGGSQKKKWGNKFLNSVSGGVCRRKEQTEGIDRKENTREGVVKKGTQLVHNEAIAANSSLAFSHRIFLRPFARQSVVTLAIRLVNSRNLRHEWIVGIRITEQ
jgi:hypothetical protein